MSTKVTQAKPFGLLGLTLASVFMAFCVGSLLAWVLSVVFSVDKGNLEGLLLACVWAVGLTTFAWGAYEGAVRKSV